MPEPGLPPAPGTPAKPFWQALRAEREDAEHVVVAGGPGVAGDARRGVGACDSAGGEASAATDAGAGAAASARRAAERLVAGDGAAQERESRGGPGVGRGDRE